MAGNEIELMRARAEARQRQARARSTGSQNSQPLLATTSDGGKIYDMGDGTRSYVADGYSTTDPAKIDQFMQGATPAQAVQQDFDRERIAANPVGARAASVAQGFPFVGSYVDEAFGGGRGENIRALQGAMSREKPIEAGALNLGGAVMGAAPMAIASGPALASAAPTSTLGQAGLGFGLGLVGGATEGAIYGAGEQQGAGRAANAQTGAMIGAGAGAALGAVAPYAAKGTRALIDRFRASDVKEIATTLGTTPAAARVIRNAIDTGDEQAAMQALQRAGADGMIADAGQPAARLLDTVASGGGSAGNIAREAVDLRTQGATRRITQALDRTLGEPQGERELIDAVRTGSQPARSAAYDAAYAAPIDYSGNNGRRLESLMPRVPASAWRRATQLMALDGDTSLQRMVQISDDGTVSMSSMPDVRQLDYVTRALNDVAAEADGAGKLGGTTDLGRLTGNLSRQIRQSLRSAVPQYGTALDTASDAITERNAIETGYTLLRPNTRREDVRDSLRGASQAQRSSARQGVRAYLDDTMANVVRTISDPDTTTREGIRALRDMSSRSNQTKLRILLGQQDADALLKDVDEAATAFELRANIAQNSKTAQRQSDMGAIDREVAPNALQTAMRGEPINAGQRLVQALTGETDEALELRRMGLYEDVATALTSQRGGQAQAALRRIQSAMRGEELSSNSARTIASALTSGGALVGSHEAQMRLRPQ